MSGKDPWRWVILDEMGNARALAPKAGFESPDAAIADFHGLLELLEKGAKGYQLAIFRGPEIAKLEEIPNIESAMC